MLKITAEKKKLLKHTFPCYPHANKKDYPRTKEKRRQRLLHFYQDLFIPLQFTRKFYLIFSIPIIFPSSYENIKHFTKIFCFIR